MADFITKQRGNDPGGGECGVGRNQQPAVFEQCFAKRSLAIRSGGGFDGEEADLIERSRSIRLRVWIEAGRGERVGGARVSEIRPAEIAGKRRVELAL